VYPKLGKRAHLYSKRETQERDGESAFRCCAVIGLRAAIFPPNGTRVCVAQEHHATRRSGVQEVLVQYRNRADKLQTRSSAHRNGTLRLSAHGLRVSTSSLTARVGCTPPPTWLPSYRDTPSSVASSSAIWQIVVFI